MSTPTRHAPSRRTVLRTAAWSTAAVTVVVATPNIAAASTPVAASAANTGSTKLGKVLTIKTTYTTGRPAPSPLTAKVKIDRDAISSITVPTGWQAPGGQVSGTVNYTNNPPTEVTFTWVGSVPASVDFNPVITLKSNSITTVVVTVTFTDAAIPQFTLTG